MVGHKRITSRDNEQLKSARRVRDGKDGERIFIEGVRLVGEAVRSGLAIDKMFVDEDAFEKTAAAVDLARVSTIILVSGSAFVSIANTVTSQGVIAIGPRPSPTRSEIEARVSHALVPAVAYLSEINNPLNLGAVVRTAEAAGIAGIIISPNSADPYSPKALRAAMGSSFRLPIVSETELDEALAWASAHNMSTVAADIRAERAYTELDWRQPRMLVLGSEGHGLDPATLEKIDDPVIIPMEDRVESLNLAVACGVILFEARRQCVG